MSDNSVRLDELIPGQWYEVDWFDEDANEWKWAKDLRLYFDHAGKLIEGQTYSVMKTGGEDDQQVVCLFPENDFGQAFLFKPRWFRVGRDKYQSKFPYRPDHSPGSSREQFREFLEAGGGIYTEGTE